jgi:Abnormal spindle-like microcephaly-assoc'd, ASPM-SPD-2-Hydin/Immunoglobulin domain/HYR domain/Fn3 associated
MKSYRSSALVILALCAVAFVVSARAQDYTITTVSNVIVITDVTGNADVLRLSEPLAGSIRFDAPGRLFRVNAGTITTNNSSLLMYTNAPFITVNAGAGADTIDVGGFTRPMPSLTINGGTGNDTVYFNGDITFAANANLDVDLQNDNASPGVDEVYVGGNVLTSGTGSITVKCSRQVSIAEDASLQTVNGNLTVEANQQALPTPGSFSGVVLDGLVRSTGTGQVVVRGRGGDGAGGYQLGVLLWFGAQIIGGTSGTVTVEGTGGASTNIVNRGITVYGTGALISSLGASVQVTGQAGGVGSSFGIGVAVLYGGAISAGGSGIVNVTGTGAGGGFFNQGIELSEPGSAISSGGGPIQISGTAGPGSSFGIYTANEASIINTNVGDSISLIADSISLPNNVSLIAGGTVTLRPQSNGTLINLGGDDTVGSLGLTDEELDIITASELVIGGAEAGSITVSAPIHLTNTAALTLVSGGGIGDTYSAGADVTIGSLTTSGNLAPGASPGIFTVLGDHTLAANSTFTVEIGGPMPGTQHDQLSISGSMEIGTNVTLNLVSFGGFVPGAGQSFTIISRGDGGGLFAGLPQGAILPNFLGSGLNARLTYAGGAGDDVVIAMLAPEIVVEQPEGTVLESGGIEDQYAATIIDYSSAYGGLDGAWGAIQVLGPPDTFSYGDISTAWSAAERDGTLEFITVGFATPVYSIGATIRETLANGFVYQVDALDTNNVLHTVWSGIDPSLPGSPAEFLITWARTPYLVKGLKVYVDTDHDNGQWEEIDSIQLHGVGSSLVNFGTVNLGSTSNLTFTIRNTGNADLTGLGITIDGAHAGDFAVTAYPTAPVSGPSGTTTFTVAFTPGGSGARSAALHIASNDSDENPFDILLAGGGIPPVAIVTNGITLTAENCGAPNGRLDPNETVTVLFSLQNLGFDNAANVTVSLQATGGVSMPSGAQSFGTLPPNGSAARPFAFTVDAPCGGIVTATLLIQTNGATYGTASCNFPVGITATTFSENFDGITTPGLPGGWTSFASPGRLPWITSSIESDSPTNAVFAPNSAPAGTSALDSPVIEIQSSSARLTFRQFLDLQHEYDGGVLEISIGEGSFEDILVAGGLFVSGGYSATLTTNSSNPLAGRQAWSGNGGEGFSIFTTTVVLPPAAAGQSIQLRWIRGASTNVFSSGWYVDSISINDLLCCDSAPEIAVEQPAGTGLFDGDANIGFGSVRIGNSATKVFVITNAGSAVLNLGGLSLSGPAAAEFTVVPPGTTALAPGEGTTFTVTFEPAALGPRNARLEIASDDIDENPFDIDLSGTGLMPAVTVTCPANISTNVPNISSTVSVSWPNPVATGEPAPVVVCVPPSGSAFPVGTTTVNCTAANSEGTNSCQFSVVGCPAYIKVTSPYDSVPGSLRQAVADLCPGGTIEFDPSLAGAIITLTNGEIVITNDMTIRGLGADQLTLSGNRASRIFKVGNVTLNLSHLTLADGRALDTLSGGAILNNGNLTLTSCAFENGFASGYGGALAIQPNANSCIISNCTFSGNVARLGGGAVSAGVIRPSDSVTFDMLGRASAYSSINVNSTERAWDIVAPGSTVTFTANYHAYYTDGAGCPGCITQHHLGINDVFNDCHDASFGSSTGLISRSFTAPATPGVYYITQTATWWYYCGQFGIPNFQNDPGSAVAMIIVGSPTNAVSAVTIRNSTFSGNYADQSGGALDINSYATIDMASSTVSENLSPQGGGVSIVSPDGLFIVRNSMVAGNENPTFFAASGGIGDLELSTYDVSGVISSAGHNIIGTSGGASGFVASDIVDTNAMLGPLHNNGGQMKTHALLPGSPAIDAGNNAGAPVFDQRGFPRIVAGTIDIGAYEAELPAPVILVDGLQPLDNYILVTNGAPVEMQSSLVGAVIRYTLDGSPPAGGILYSGVFAATEPVLVRAVAVSANLSLSAESEFVFVDVGAPPSILAQPAGRMVGTGAEVPLSVTAGGTEPLSFQWARNGVALPGATGPSLLLPNIQPGQGGDYTVSIANDFGAITSAIATVVVAAGPGILTQPANVTVGLGGTATFSVVATGPPPLLYQWRKNGANVLGATNDTFTITNVQFDDGASYTVVVATSGGTIVSDPALLIVTTPSAPPGDDYVDAGVLRNASGSATGTNNFTTREPGEPLHAGKPGSNSIWYAWTAPAKGIATFRTAGSTFDTLMGIYTGTNVASLATVVSDEDGGGFLSSRVSYNTTPGTVYHIAIDGLNGQQGSFVLRWEFTATDTDVAEIDCHPASLTVLPGQDATFTVRATGPSLTYQWLFNGSEIWGATQSNYTRLDVQPRHVGYYSVRVTSTATQTVESAAALLEIGLDPNLQSRDKPDDVEALCPAVFAPAAGASSVAMGSVGYQILVSSSTNNLIDCNTTNCGGIPTGTRYMELQPAAAGIFILDTVGSASRTKLWVCRAGTNNLDKTRTYLTCDVDGAMDGRSIVSFAAEAGRTYQVWISRLDNTNGVLQLNWKLGLPPRIASVSTNRFVMEGAGTTLSVLATNIIAAGVPATNALSAPTYTWYFNGTIPVASGPTLTLNNLGAANAGQYMAVAGNEVGTTSAVVRVELFGAPELLVINSGGTTELFADATTSACGAAATRYQWRLNGLALTGKTNRSLILQGTQPAQAGQYSVTVSNCFGAITYVAASVAVTVDLGFTASIAEDKVMLSWQATTGKRYRVEYRANPDGGSWTSFQPDLIATASIMTFMDALGAIPRFYRVVLLD